MGTERFFANKRVLSPESVDNRPPAAVKK